MTQGSSISSTNNTTITQPPIQTQPITSRNYDPPPLPNFDISTSSSISQQPGHSTNNINSLIRPHSTFQPPPTPERPPVTTQSYTPAQRTTDTKVPFTFNINNSHTNLLPTIVTSRTLSRPPLQTIPIYPLQYNLNSTNTHCTQNSVNFLIHKTQTIKSTSNIQNEHVTVPQGSSTKTNPYFTPMIQVPISTKNVRTNISHSNYQITHTPAHRIMTVSSPTYINSSASI